MPRQTAFLSIVALALLAVATRAHAQDATPATPHAAEITIAATDDEFAVLRLGVEEELARLHVRAAVARANGVRADDVVTARPSAPPFVAHVWLDFTAQNEATLYVAEASAERILVRRFERAGREELAREATLNALGAAIGALLHGGRIGVTRDEARRELGLPPERPPPSEVAPPRPPLPRSAPEERPPAEAGVLTLGLALFYEIGGYSSRLLEQGPGAAAIVTRRIGARTWGLWASGQARLPLVATRAPITLHIDSFALRAGAALDVHETPDFTLRASLGAGADVTYVLPRLLDAVDASLIPASRVDVVLRAGLTARVKIAPRIVAEAGVAVEAVPTVQSYVVLVGDAPTELVSPWPVRPAVWAGVAVP